MGMQATLTIIPAKSYHELAKDPDADVSLSGKSFDIDKAWSYFHDAFEPLGEPLQFAIEGELCPYGNFAENDTGMNDGFVSPVRASEIAEALKKLSFDSVLVELQKVYKKRRFPFPMEDDEDEAYLREHYATLVKAYEAAAKKKAAVHIGIA